VSENTWPGKNERQPELLLFFRAILDQRAPSSFMAAAPEAEKLRTASAAYGGNGEVA